MGLESLLTENHTFTWPFRNPLNGPFIHKIGLIFYASSLIIIFSSNKFNLLSLSLLFIFISFFFSLLSGHRAGSFNFVIITLILILWPSFNLRKSIIIIIGFFLIMLLLFYLSPIQFDRYFVSIINFSNTSLLQYIGLWKTGINVFSNNPFIGIGPTNVQNYLELGLIQNFDPYKNNEHPHNHYIQAFAETGIIGGFAYIGMFVSIIKYCYQKTKIKLVGLDKLIIQGILITSICLFWPFANNYDLFGQQQNGFLWYVISIILVSNYSIKKYL